MRYPETLHGAMQQAKDVIAYTVDGNSQLIKFGRYWLAHGLLEGAEFLNFAHRYPMVFPQKTNLVHAFGGYLTHDLGKVSGRLRPEDWFERTGVMTPEKRKYHVIDGIEALARFEQSTETVLPGEHYRIVNGHHERWDGSGYSGLSGEQIGLIERVAGVLDTIVAMCQRRPYNADARITHSFESAWREMSVYRGRKYAPEIFDMVYAMHEGDPRISEPGVGWIDFRTDPELFEISREHASWYLDTNNVQ